MPATAQKKVRGPGIAWRPSSPVLRTLLIFGVAAYPTRNIARIGRWKIATARSDRIGRWHFPRRQGRLRFQLPSAAPFFRPAGPEIRLQGRARNFGNWAERRAA